MLGGCAPADCDMSDTFMIQFVKGLRLITRLRTLNICNISGPRIATAGTAAFAATLCYVNRLESLDFGGRRAHAQALRICFVVQFRAHVLPFPILGALDLNVDGATQLALGLHTTPMLTSLSLHGTPRRDVPAQ